MIDILILIGKTASGKDLIINKLVSEHNFNRIIRYTTRSIRKNEKQDITYHYISTSDFMQKIDNGYFAEWKSYVTAEGLWYYGTALKDLENTDENSVIILPPSQYRKVIKKLSQKPISIYLYANNSTIKKRLIGRNNNTKENERRLIRDNEDFKGIENEVDKIVYNNDCTNINEVVDKILEFLEEQK